MQEQTELQDMAMQAATTVTIYTPDYTPTEMSDSADDLLFQCIFNFMFYVLQSYIRDKSHSQCHLSKISHDKEFIVKTTKLDGRDFLIRLLYKNCYCYIFYLPYF